MLLLVVEEGPPSASGPQQRGRLLLRHGQLLGEQQVLLRPATGAAFDLGAAQAEGHRAVREHFEPGRKSGEDQDGEDQQKSNAFPRFGCTQGKTRHLFILTVHLNRSCSEELRGF